MGKFIVYVREVYVQGYSVDAEDELDAKRRVADGDGDLLEDSFEYSHSLDPEMWTVGRW